MRIGNQKRHHEEPGYFRMKNNEKDKLQASERKRLIRSGTQGIFRDLYIFCQILFSQFILFLFLTIKNKIKFVFIGINIKNVTNC